MKELLINREQLDFMKKQHIKELKLLRNMTDKQFEIFRKNFSLGKLDDKITRKEAIDILISMIALNWRLKHKKSL